MPAAPPCPCTHRRAPLVRDAIANGSDTSRCAPSLGKAAASESRIGRSEVLSAWQPNEAAMAVRCRGRSSRAPSDLGKTPFGIRTDAIRNANAAMVAYGRSRCGHVQSGALPRTRETWRKSQVVANFLVRPGAELVTAPAGTVPAVVHEARRILSAFFRASRADSALMRSRLRAT